MLNASLTKKKKRVRVRAAQRFLSTPKEELLRHFHPSKKKPCKLVQILWRGAGWSQVMSWMYGWKVMPTICLLKLYFLKYLGINFHCFCLCCYSHVSAVVKIIGIYGAVSLLDVFKMPYFIRIFNNFNSYAWNDGVYEQNFPKHYAPVNVGCRENQEGYCCCVQWDPGDENKCPEIKNMLTWIIF